MTTRLSSSWLSSLSYLRGSDGQTFLALFLHRQDRKDEPVAFLYRGVPSWLPGLIKAGTARRSPGRAYNKLLKGRYSYQRIEGEERVRELRRLMEAR